MPRSRTPSIGIPTVLAVKTHALGDLLLVTPALHLLRTGFPEATLLVLTTTQCAPLLKCNGDIDSVITMPNLSYLSAARALPTLRRAAPSQAVVFQASPAARLVARLGGARKVHALDRSDIDSWPPPFDRYTADAYLELAGRAVSTPLPHSHYPRLFVEPNERAAARERAGAAPFAVIAAGGGRNARQSVPAKRWRAARWGRLCDLITREIGLETVLVGAHEDIPQVTQILRASSVAPRNLAGATDLRTLAALIAEASLVVTIDSVALHMAVALNRPLVGLFGPTSCANFLPTGRDHQRGVSSTASCSPCYGNGLFPGCRRGTPVCMQAITEDAVWEEVRSVVR
ncbi:glycosyltransferase family 9 protein [Candidatus Fermentibacteria bacterium]|nr:glycosyltransferase family 9 protein [Candidatus Fermentibacteria bacterium]